MLALPHPRPAPPEPPEREALPASKRKKLTPSQDRTIPHPGKSFYCGQWRTPEQKAEYRRRYAEIYYPRYRTDPEFVARARERDRKRYAKDPAGEMQRKKAYRERLIEQGLCMSCAKNPLATAASTRCNKCLDKKLTPQILLKSRRAHAARRGRDASKIDPLFANHIEASIDVNKILEGVMGNG